MDNVKDELGRIAAEEEAPAENAVERHMFDAGAESTEGMTDGQ